MRGHEQDPRPGQLPDEVVDHGDRIEVKPTRRTRLVFTAAGLGAIVLGLVLGVLAPGDLGDGALARFGLSTALVVAGAAALVLQRRRIEFDPAGATRHAVLGSRTVPWSDVERLRVEERREHGGGRFGTSRRLGPLRISFGPGARHGRGFGPAFGSERVVAVRVEGAGQRDLRMTLNEASADDGAALLAELQERGWVPDAIPVAVDGDR